MPEGDTVWRSARRLHQALAGEPITQWDLRWADLATTDLTGATTLEVRSRGKHILQRLDAGLTLHTHLRMEGQWRIEASAAVGARTLGNPQLRAVVGTARWTALGLRLGMVDLVPTSEESTLVGHLGPDVLGEDWDLWAAVDRVRAATEPIGAALLDQRTVAGVGTMWASEVLFLHRVNPWTPASALAPDAVAELLTRAHQLISAACRHAMPSSTGIRRTGENTYVHGRSGRPCRRCGGTVRVAMIGRAPQDRTMFYCPCCQGGLGPTDDDRQQRPLGSSAGAFKRPYRRS